MDDMVGMGMGSGVGGFGDGVGPGRGRSLFFDAFSIAVSFSGFLPLSGIKVVVAFPGTTYMLFCGCAGSFSCCRHPAAVHQWNSCISSLPGKRDCYDCYRIGDLCYGLSWTQTEY